MSELAVQTPAGWQANMALEFRRTGARTVLAGRTHRGPLRVQRPFYPEGSAVCHVYVLHPPGGVVGGDELRLHVDAGAAAAGLLTTPAANKVYRSEGLCSVVEQRFRVGAGASLEWLPQGTLLFGGSRLRQRSVIELVDSARCCLWEITCLGRPASGDQYSSGVADVDLEIWRDGRPLLIERQSWSAGDAMLSAQWGLGGHAALGALYGYPADPDTVARARRCVDSVNVAISEVDGLLVVKVLSADAVEAQARLSDIWRCVRPLVIGRSACTPRIWAT